MPSTVAVYLRTSTDGQDGAAQRHALAHAIEAGAVVYEDRGESGAKASRPAWDRLRGDVRAGRVRELHAYALDRFGRSTVAVVLAVEDFARAGVRVTTVREGTIDPSTPTGAFMVTILAALATMERQIIRDRVNAGIRKARDKGTRSGRAFGRPPRVTEAKRAEIVRLRASGASWRTIAQTVGLPTSTCRGASSC